MNRTQKRKLEIINLLENEYHFRDYVFLRSSQWKKITRAASINLLNPTNNELEDAINIFCRDGYSVILIYLGGAK